MKRANPKAKITHQEIENALNHFFEKGGKVEIVPAQKAVSLSVIGADKWAAYESLGDLNF